MENNQDTTFILDYFILKQTQDFFFFLTELINLNILFQAFYFANFILASIIEEIELMIFIFVFLLKTSFEEISIFHIIIISNGLSLLNIKRTHVENLNYANLEEEETEVLDKTLSSFTLPPLIP